MDQPKKAEEKRQFKRINASLVVLYKINSPLILRMFFGAVEVDAAAVDISEGGIGIMSNFKLPKSALITVRFDSLGNEDHFMLKELKGEVRYSIFMKEKRLYRLGIRFLDLSAGERDFITSLVKMVALKGSPVKDSQ